MKNLGKLSVANLLGFLKRNLKINNADIKSCPYKTLVRPTLEYCSMVSDPHTAKAVLKLKMVQY